MWNKELDASLKQLAVEAQQHPPQSKKRQLALTRLVMEIKRSGQLCRPYSGQFSGVYQEIYDEACNRVFLYLCQNIDRYDPNKEVLQWVNFLLKKRFNDAIKSIVGDVSQPKRFVLNGEKRDRGEFSSAVESNPLLSEEIIFWIQSDPDGLFQHTHVAGRPEANFQYLVLQRLEGDSWQNLSEQLQISLKTLSCFHDRCLTKFAPKLKSYLQS